MTKLEKLQKEYRSTMFDLMTEEEFDLLKRYLK